MFVIRTLTTFRQSNLSQINFLTQLIVTVQTFKKQNSMDMEKYNGLPMDILYLVRQPQTNNGIVIINFAVNAFE